jgi:hypothetical protein
MRLKPVGLPDSVDHERADALGARHRTHAPVGRVRGLGLTGGFDNRRDPLRTKLFTPSGTGRVAQQTRNACQTESFAPQRDRRPADLQFLGQPMVGLAFARAQNNTRSPADFLRHIPPLRQLHQLLPLLGRHLNRLRSAPHVIDDNINSTHSKASFQTGD